MKQLTHAREALQCAQADIEAMRKAKSLIDMRTAWISFLSNLNRSFNKAQAELKENRKWQGWTERGRILDLCRGDPLLSYLRNARGAEEHGIKPIAKETPDTIQFLMPLGSRGFSIEKIETSVNGSVNIVGKRGTVEVNVTPPKFELIPVTNRGRTYELPATHLGTELLSCQPIDLAEAGHRFYQGFFERAEAELL
jgi:hypothetical protein